MAHSILFFPALHAGDTSIDVFSSQLKKLGFYTFFLQRFEDLIYQQFSISAFSGAAVYS
jgi:hypothetical protein